ncbi:unnamed protein product, partial [Symbiodinium necroappetens]
FVKHSVIHGDGPLQLEKEMLVEVQARGLDAKRNLWAKHLQEAATWKRDPAPPRQFHVGLVQDAAHSARMLKAVWLIGSRHLEQVAAALHAWQVLAVKVSRCRNEVSHELGLRVRLVVLAKAFSCWLRAGSRLSSAAHSWKRFLQEMQMAHRHLAAAGTIQRSLESKIQMGAKLRMPSLELQDLFAAWWSLTAEAKLDVWNAAAVSISAQLGGHSSCTSMLLREHAETFAAPESFSTSSECGGSEYSEPDDLQTDAGWQLGSCSVGVECSQHDSWDSQGWKGWFLLPLAFRAWRGTTLMQQQQLCSARYKAYLWDNSICCFIAWELLVVRGRALHSKLAGSCRLQDRRCLDVFTAWKTVLLESRGKRASVEALCKLKRYSNHAVRSCWNAWYSTRDTVGLAWRGVVIGMLRQQGRQRALECLVDAMDARSEREHTERSMALQQRADKLLIDLVFVVWKSACETSQLRHRLDKTGLTANDAVTDLVTYHSQAARLAAMSSIFAGWSMFARLQRQRQRCSRNIDKQYRHGNAETLGCCLFAWQQISFCAQYRGKLEVCSARRWDTLLSSRCFYLWMQIAQWMHASQGVDETGSRAGFQHAAESRADVLVELCTRGLLVPHPLVRDAIRYAFLAWKSEHLQANLLAVQGSEAGKLFALQRSCGLVHLALHAWWHLQLKQRTSSAHLQRLETLLSRTTMEQYFRRWLLYSFCPSKLLPWVRIVLSLRAEVKLMCRTSSDVQADQALSVPKEEVAVLRQVPAAQADEVTDEEEQPEEEQVPAVYQPIMTPTNGPLAGHCTRSSSSSSNLDSVQRSDDASSMAPAPLLPEQGRRLDDLFPRPAISNVEDLHRRLYVEQASLMRRVFHRWWDMSLAGQLRLVELRAPLVERHACPESRLPAASHPNQPSRQRAASSSLVRPAGRAACLARLLQEAETAALDAVKVSASGAGHAHKENMLENDIAPTPAKAKDDERRWGDETWLLAKSRQPAVVPVQLHWGLKGTKEPVTPASGTKEPVTRAALLAASQI